jgi:hypothetical protein
MRNFACILALAALIAAPLAARADDDPAAAPPAAETAAQPQPTPLSELDVVAKKATPFSGLDVVVKRRPATNLSGVEVKEPATCLPPRSPADQEVPAPKLVSTYPADGQTVPPGYAVLRLTFDLPMACRGSLPKNLINACFSDGVETWHESFDRRSLMILCDLKPGTHYVLAVNRNIPQRFQGLSGREPDSSRLTFQTSEEPLVTTAEALVGRDPQLAAMLAAAASSTAAVASKVEIEDQPRTAKVSGVQVKDPPRCLPPRAPPDPDVPAPKLVSTFPAQGQTVRPGILELRFTFDLPMACVGGVEIKDGTRNPCTDVEIAPALVYDRDDHPLVDPTATEHWSQPWDRRSMRFLCQVEPGKRYVMMINKARIATNHPPWPKFKGLGGKETEPYELTFWTSHDAPVRTQEDAAGEDPFNE